MRFHLLVVALLVSLLTHRAHAVVVTQWDFNSPSPDNDSSTGTQDPSVGLGSLTFHEAIISSWADGSPNDPAAIDNSAARLIGFPSSNLQDVTRGLEIKVSTVGFENIQLSFDLRHDSKSSKYGAIQYSLDGSNFVTHSYFGANNANTYYTRTVDLSSIPGVSENADFAIRIVSAFERTATGSGQSKYVPTSSSTYSSAGPWQFDNVTISGASTIAAVPENSSWILCGAVVVVAGLGSRLRSVSRSKRMP